MDTTLLSKGRKTILARHVTSWIDWSVKPTDKFWKVIEELIPYAEIDRDELENHEYELRDSLNHFCKHSDKYINEEIKNKLFELREQGYIGKYFINGKNDSELLLLIAIFSTAEHTGYIDILKIMDMIVKSRIEIEEYCNIVESQELSLLVKKFLLKVGNKLYDNQERIKQGVNSIECSNY
jgi:hypothetical protein